MMSHPMNGENIGHSAATGHPAQREEASPRDAQRPVYHISVVAQMVETHPQTLRMYERMGLVAPQRTRHNIRLYSDSDVEQVRRIQHLTQDLGVNLAGVEVVFKLLEEMERMRGQVEDQMEMLRTEVRNEMFTKMSQPRGNGKSG